MSALTLLVCLAAGPLAEAQGHLEHGRYEEAIDAFRAADGADPVAAALGISRAQMETGRYAEAGQVLDEAVKKSPERPELLARRGEVRLLTGDYEGALGDAEAALKLDAEHPAAHWVKAEALTEIGRIAEAADECRWFVRFYNRRQPKEAEALVYVAKGAVRYARWKRVSSVFGFVVNELCPDLAKAAPDDWRADAISGGLLLEKYNEGQGIPDLKKALAKNPHAAEVHAALAAAAVENGDLERAGKELAAALADNPACVPAFGLKADVAVMEGDLAAAGAAVGAALAVNPRDQESLGRQAALAVLRNEVDAKTVAAALAAVEAGEPAKIGAASEFGRLVAELLRRNPKPGAFLYRFGATLEHRRLYAEAERAYEAAMKVMPELSEPQVALALLSMRAGDLKRAKAILDAAFKADPFHVRVNNMRKVVGLLEGYETVETPHFVVRFDPATDRVLAELAAECLENAYPELTGEFGYEPPGKTVVELFHAGKGQSGHEWFSARMVGLPWLQTVGASTGLMLALASPTSGPAYNWVRVVRHEFTHVVTLQQTEFRIPTWYTEALAVRSEGCARPEEWDELLRKRVPKGELRSLDELDPPFSRPKSSDDRQFAYCQSLLYAQYMDDRFGKETHRKLLDAYTRGLTSEKAIPEATGVALDEFEKGYRERLAEIAKGLGPAADEDEPTPELRAVLKEAIGAIRRKEFDTAAETLEKAFDRDQPQPDVLELLGKAKLLGGDAKGAAELFALGRETFPHDRRWPKLQAAALLKVGDSPELKPLLEEIANTDADDALAAKKLAEVASKDGDAAAAKRWALRTLYVTPNDAAVHLILAEACEKLGETARAATARRHAELVKELDAKDTNAADVDGGDE
jgi:tetratricopeptide (TPR) repeat protein